MRYFVLDIGCAECRFFDASSLVERVVGFDTLEEAKASVPVSDAVWKDHHLGGIYYPTSEGEYWIVPSEVFTSKENPIV